ncbi:MAG: adenylate/guanylate cyclase domain-containing protein [Deltaproteobacteria bacterium]|nr:adenylate/guanylate cyclase domain-containing protein [Deltaproteobacteria bacterium]
MAQAETRKLAAIMFTDIVGFSRQMGADEARMLRLLAVHNQVVEQAVAAHQGRVIKTAGDGFLVDFPSVVHAVQCAQHIQVQLHTHNADKEKGEQIHVRVGIHLGDIVVQPNGDVLGDGVNIASRLQTLAEPDTICISHKVYEEVGKKIPLGTVIALGRPKLKNIAPRFPIYALLPEPPKGLRQTLRVQRLKLSRRVGTAHRVVALAGLLALVSAGTLLVRNRYFSSLAGLPLPDKPSVVVLPFVNMSADPTQEYFSDGITEDLTTDLSKIASLFVISRNSAFTYKGKAVKVQDVSREMGVRYVLEGSVRRSDSQIRITAQLIDATSGGHIWSERYERPLQEIFAVQDEIRQQIVFALRVKLTPEEQARFKNAPTNNLEAYDYYLRGLQLLSRPTRETNAQARQMYEKAIELDPQYAAAYASLSFTYWMEWFVGWSQDPQTLKRGFELAQKAVALDDSLPGAHSTLGIVYLIMKQHEPAIAEAERAIALDPNFADGYATLATILGPAGRPEEAIELAKQAMRLNPHYLPWYLNALGFAYLSAGWYEEAIAPLKQALSRNPNVLPPHVNLAVVYSELGRLEEAQAEVAEILRISPAVSLESTRQRLIFKDPVVAERFYVRVGPKASCTRAEKFRTSTVITLCVCGS